MRYNKEYDDALASAHWRKLRKIAEQRSHRRCEKCGRSTENALFGLSLHHVTYERLGAELPEDVLLLCPRCHREMDFERMQPDSEQSVRFRLGLDAYATKYYGPGWQFGPDADDIVNEFSERRTRTGGPVWQPTTVHAEGAANKPKKAPTSQTAPRERLSLRTRLKEAALREAMKHRIIERVADPKMHRSVAGRMANLIVYYAFPAAEVAEVLDRLDQLRQTGQVRFPGSYFTNWARQVATDRGLPFTLNEQKLAKFNR
jgi:hypothetical protein